MAIRKLGNNEETPSTLIIGLKHKYQNPKEQSQCKIMVEKKAGNLCFKEVHLLLNNPSYLIKHLKTSHKQHMFFHWSMYLWDYTQFQHLHSEQNSGCSVQQQMFVKNTPTVMGKGMLQRLLQTHLQTPLLGAFPGSAFSPASAQASSLQDSLSAERKRPKNSGKRKYVWRKEGFILRDIISQYS